MVAIGLMVAAFVVQVGIPSLSRSTVAASLLGAGGALSVTAAMLRINADVLGDTVTDEAAAKDYLKQIRFQHSREASGTAELGLPSGIGLGVGSSTTLARTPWTLPEAVEEFRRFVGRLSGRFVVIGIDELDKMESDVAAREFLNNIKGSSGSRGATSSSPSPRTR